MIGRLFLTACCLFAAATALAGPYTSLVVFGDSLSDVGNTSAATFGVSPGSGYFQGRYSNGPVYPERLATGLRLPALTRSGAGGNDFAYGGARTTGTGGLAGLFLNDLDEQVTDFLRFRTADPTGLYAVFIGANDLFGGEQNATALAGRVQTQISRLVNAGVRNLLGINLPLLGLTPDYNTNASNAASISNLTRATNAALENVYRAIETANPAVTIERLDVERLFSDLIALPAADAASVWGFTNRAEKGQGVGDPSGYIFWDGVHPTARAHTVLADAALRAVLPVGDYDLDGAVDADDYDAWSAAYGDRFATAYSANRRLVADANGDGQVNAADYTAWRDGLGGAPTSVPEPAGMLVAMMLVAGATRRHSSPAPSSNLPIASR
ncbi:MAG: SGNH/GDSL hydrolase family protein [Lacipirellulaceae bacterium]